MGEEPNTPNKPADPSNDSARPLDAFGAGLTDSNEPESADVDEFISGEDEPALLEAHAHALDEPVGDDVPDGSRPTDEAEPPKEKLAPDDMDDIGNADEKVVDDPATTVETNPDGPVNWDKEVSAHRLIVELKRVEGDVRRLLQDRDTRQRRKLAGTRRWQELEEDIISWRFGGRFDENSLCRLQELIARRHYLVRRLSFLVRTRPTWNT